MKKILLSFFTVSFIVGGFIFLIKPVMAETIDEGCLANQNYNANTGEACARDVQVTGFLTADVSYSNTMWASHSITNDGYAVCVTTPCPSASLSYLVNTSGSDSVLADLIKYENSKVKITGKLMWVPLGGGFWGIVATNITPYNNDSIKDSYLINRTLRIGYKGEDVKNLQMLIGATADGSFGPMTKMRVMEWQRKNGLNPDGIFGPASRAKAGLMQ